MKILGEEERDPYSYPEHHLNLYLNAKKGFIDLFQIFHANFVLSAVLCHPTLISFTCGVINHDRIVASSAIYRYTSVTKEKLDTFFSDISYHINNAFTFFSRQRR